MNERPNILLLLTDQQNAGMLSCAGNQFLTTPAMDTLAAEGVRFERAYCTNPVCVPSRFSLLTGQMPSVAGLRSNRVTQPDRIRQVAQAGGAGFRLRAAGYDTAYAGGVHLPGLSAADVGFEHLGEDGRDQLADTCAAFLRQEHSRPFCLVASFINPHDICYMAIRDFAQTEAERQMIARAKIECATLDAALVGADDRSPPLPPNFEPQTDEPEAIRILLEQRPFRLRARREWTASRWRMHRWAYARLTEMVDRQIGRVLDALREAGQWEQTLVVLTSDHGDMDAAHRLEHKSVVYDEATRIPLIIRPPGNVRPGRVDDTHLVSNGLDLLPTFCDWAGAPTTNLPGRSLRSLVEGIGAAVWRESLPVETALGRAIVTRSFKYARYDIGGDGEQLVDLVADPYEQRNVARAARYAPPLADLRGVFQECFARDTRSPTAILQDATAA